MYRCEDDHHFTVMSDTLSSADESEKNAYAALTRRLESLISTI